MGLIHKRIRPQVAEQFLALTFVVHQVETLAVVFRSVSRWAMMKSRRNSFQSRLPPAWPNRDQPSVTVVAESFEELVFQAQVKLSRCRDRPAPARPKSWRSTRMASCRSVPMTCKPAGFGDARAELDVGAAAGHVGRDRHLAGWPACETMVASSLSCLALSTRCGMPSSVSRSETASDFSTDRVPIKTGRPAVLQSLHFWTMASNFASSVGKTRSGRRLRMIGLLVGTGTTPQLVDAADLLRVLHDGAGHPGHLAYCRK